MAAKNLSTDIVTPTFPAPPCSLYVHIPWCIRKCPYCDFNSHESQGLLPEKEYLASLLRDLNDEVHYFKRQRDLPALTSVFFGGGTPSLLSPETISKIITAAQREVGIIENIEITLEANPGAVDREKFEGYRNAGVNRLSLGVQSFSPEQLKALGRIHNRQDIERAFQWARQVQFDNINIDLMFGLPDQTPEQAQQDLKTAIGLDPEHISWYQLTIEPNTTFFNFPPPLPGDDIVWEIHQLGIQVLNSAGFEQYEVSAFARSEKYSQHNLNYWQFGDYMAIGAGAHGKCSSMRDKKITRHWKTRMPQDFLNRVGNYRAGHENIEESELPFEYLMNALRLRDGVSEAEYIRATGLEISSLQPHLQRLRKMGLVEKEKLQCTTQGYLHLNTVLSEFISA